MRFLLLAAIPLLAQPAFSQFCWAGTDERGTAQFIPCAANPAPPEQPPYTVPRHTVIASVGAGARSGVEREFTADLHWRHNGKDLFLRTWTGVPLLRAAYALPLWIRDPKLFIVPGIMIEHGRVHPAVGVMHLLGPGTVYSNHATRHQIAGTEWMFGGRYGVKLSADYHFLAGSVRWWSGTIGIFWRLER